LLPLASIGLVNKLSRDRLILKVFVLKINAASSSTAGRGKLLRVYKLSGDYFVAVFYSIDRSLVAGKMRELQPGACLPE
jgi:hypothetical protein